MHNIPCPTRDSAKADSPPSHDLPVQSLEAPVVPFVPFDVVSPY